MTSLPTSPPEPKAPRLKTAAFHGASFLSAFLLFQIQPIMAKAMLPGFGGSYLVWGTCMAFFQGLLVVGYTWSHELQKRAGITRYARWHWLVLLPPLFFMPFHLEVLAEPDPSRTLYLEVMLLLLLAAAVPFFALATASPLLQAWLGRSGLPASDNPYVLYSASNLGSMTALLSYPIVVEPFFDLQTQSWLWAGAYVLLLLFFAVCTPPRSIDKPEAVAGSAPVKVTKRQLFTWFLLSASGSAMLIAVTNLLTFDVASVPFLWILPLSTYLFTFVLVFKRRPWIPQKLGVLFYWVAMIGMAIYLLTSFRWGLPILPSIAIQLAVLFLVAMRVHGLLAETKPKGLHDLTAFYVVMSVGGFCGTLLISGLIPVVTTSLVEYPLAFVLAAVAISLAKPLKGAGGPEPKVELNPLRSRGFAIALVCVPVFMIGIPAVVPDVPPDEAKYFLVLLVVPAAFVLLSRKNFPLQTAAVLAFITLCVPLSETLISGSEGVKRHRNHYGIYKIYDSRGIRFLQHGTTLHGSQYLDTERAATPLAYYHPSTPAGNLISSDPLDFNTVGMIGLGTGAIALLMEPGELIRIYELDPDNLPIAREEFTYLDLAEARGVEMDFVFGDGRVRLRDTPPDSYDAFIVDAFSSGSIPVHLMTVEAIREYLRVLRPGGVILFHVSNRTLALEPVVFSLGEELDLHVLRKSNELNVHPDAEHTTWMALTRSGDAADVLRRDGWEDSVTPPEDLPRPWTDQFTNLLTAVF